MKNDNPINFRFKNIRWALLVYDILIFLFSGWFMLVFYIIGKRLTFAGTIIQVIASGMIVFVSRFALSIYSQVWRYGGIQSYIKLIASDALAFTVYYAVQDTMLVERIIFARAFSLFCMNLLLALSFRMVYRYAYKFGGSDSHLGKILTFALKVATFGTIKPITVQRGNKIKVAIIGAGNIGITLAEELIQSKTASYLPVCFVDTDPQKTGREIHDLKILPEDDQTLKELENLDVQEVIFTIASSESERRKQLYNFYKDAGYKIKVYDYPTVENAGSKKRHLREFDIEELLFRASLDVIDEKTRDYYRGKTVLITGGGGSIGSELCRQIAKMSPHRIIILDIYENGAYDIQQELKIAYGNSLDIRIEIVSVTNRTGLERVFKEYRPQLVLNAAAHKHVPLMERNCIEAVENNVFGTLNTVELSEKYGAERVIMVSTDKAVNPTNIMGATKRMCELIVQAHSAVSKETTFSTTRFGNVLGSAGSVIPLFKKQIAHGGPLTITDKRIIRYFMTIPEASQLVLVSGAMAKNGDLFVLDMGQPIKIMDLAENMIRLSGMEPGVDIEIRETGLRPGEKLYEELLIKSESLGKTDNELIFVENDSPLEMDELNKKLSILKEAVETDSDEEVRKAMMKVIPTYRTPGEVNKKALEAEEMKNAKNVKNAK